MRAARWSAAAGTASALALGHVLPAGTWLRAARLRLLPRIAGMGRAGHLALTFDDGPDLAGTPAILGELDRLGWRATFFLLGSQVVRRPSLAAEIVAAGHEVGVHGFDHRSLLFRTPAQTEADLAAAVDVIAGATGHALRWYRPPYGVLTTAALLTARRHSLSPILWSAWGRDWRDDATPASILAELRRGVLPAGTALLHDSDISSMPGSWHATAAALPLLAEHVHSVGLAVGPLAEHGIPAGR